MNLRPQKRDWELFEHIYATDLVTTPQAAALVFHDGYDLVTRNVMRASKPEGNENTAAKRLYKLKKAGYLELEYMPTLPFGDRQLWRLAPKLFAVLNDGSAKEMPAPISSQNVPHHLAAVDCYVAAVNRLRTSGSQARIVWRSERGNARFYTKEDGTTGKIIPDATLQVAGRNIFFERQRKQANKRAEYLAGRVKAYAKYIEQAPRELQDSELFYAVDTPAQVDTIMRFREHHPGLYLTAGSPEQISARIVEAVLSEQGEGAVG